MKPLPDWVKYTVFILIIVSFLAIMVILAIQKETDKLMALAGILVAICASNIFNVRAEIEKARALLELDIKRQAIFQDLEKEKEKSLILNNKRIEGYEKILFLLVHIEDHFKILSHWEDKEKREKYNSDYHKLFDLMTEYRIYTSQEIYELLVNIKDDIEDLDLFTLTRTVETTEIQNQCRELKMKILTLNNLIKKELGIS